MVLSSERCVGEQSFDSRSAGVIGLASRISPLTACVERGSIFQRFKLSSPVGRTYLKEAVVIRRAKRSNLNSPDAAE
ncbi:hypothetical protein LA080_007931 [Diaporthe eres]|nr:hypothetical protein LA080_007931 [Diaporthe eres]